METFIGIATMLAIAALFAPTWAIVMPEKSENNYKYKQFKSLIVSKRILSLILLVGTLCAAFHPKEKTTDFRYTVNRDFVTNSIVLQIRMPHYYTGYTIEGYLYQSDGSMIPYKYENYNLTEEVKKGETEIIVIPIKSKIDLGKTELNARIKGENVQAILRGIIIFIFLSAYYAFYEIPIYIGIRKKEKAEKKSEQNP